MDSLNWTVKVVLLVLVVCLFSGFIYAGENLDEKYCHDMKSWTEWEELIRKYPEDTQLQMLHALRIGFCKMIEYGTISFEKASSIFGRLNRTRKKGILNFRSRFLNFFGQVLHYQLNQRIFCLVMLVAC